MHRRTPPLAPLALVLLSLAGGFRSASALPVATSKLPTASPDAPPSAAKLLAGAPVQFVSNVGQFGPATRFVGTAPGATIRFEDAAVRYQFRRPAAGSGEAAGAAAGMDRFGRRGPLEYESLEIRATFPGSRPAETIEGRRETAHRSHFYIGNDPARWRTDVKGYEAVRMRGLYPGVDLEVHGTGRELEYDFHVAPGADPRAIRVRYDGIERLRVTARGELELTTRFGRTLEAAPVAFQEIGGVRVPVRARYRRVDDVTFAFDVGPRHDARLPLVIDPVLKYSTYLGGITYDEVHEIVSDFAGNAYIVGGTLSPDFPATGSPVPGADYVAYVTKIAPNGGSLVYSVFLGGSANQIGYGLRIDAAGNAYLAGTTGSNDFPTTTGCYDPTFNGSNAGQGDLFIAKLSPTGTLLYSTYLGSPDADTGGRVALTSAGHVCVLAVTADAAWPVTTGAYDVTWNGGNDIAVAILNPAGGGASDLVYSTYLGGNGDDEAYDIEADYADKLYLAGSTRSVNFPATGGPPFNSTFDAVVAKINPAGAGPADLVFATKFGGVGQDYGGGVKPTGIGEVYFSGSTSSSNMGGISGWQNTYGGGTYDGFLFHLYADGSTVFWGTFLGDTGEDRCGDIVLDAAENPTVLGYTNSPAFTVTGSSYDPSFNGGYDMFLLTFDFSGTPFYGTFLGGTSNEFAYALTQDVGGRMYVTGNTQSSDYPFTSGAYDGTFNGGPIDVVVTKFATNGPDTCETCYSPPDTCCAIPPPLTDIEHPFLSPNVLVGTRQKTSLHPYSVTIFDLGSPLPSPLEDTDWATILRYNGPSNSWTQTALGTVFGLTLDKFGNIFVTHTSCYSPDAIGTVSGAAPGAIYRIDGNNGSITTFCVLPNFPDGSVTPPDDYPALGNISYDCRHDQFFVTNLEDGRIYRIKANGFNGTTGTVQETFDPLAPDNNQPGWAPAGERLWGVQVHGDRVYYAVWVEDIFAPNTTLANEIRSVALLPSGAFDTGAGSDRHELFMPQTYWNVAASNPVSDISFSASGRMLVAERDIYGLTYPNAHSSRAIEFECVAGCWLPTNPFQVGVIGPFNSAGGVDYDRFPYTGGAIGRVWVSGDAIHLQNNIYTDAIYGYQGFRPTGGTVQNSVLVDSDGVTSTGDKTSIGDVEAPGCVDNTVGSVCGKKFHDQNRNGVQNGSEPALAGWTIVLNGPGGPYFAVTDAFGNYCFNGLQPGNYTLGEVGQSGWIQTAPSGGTYNVTIVGGQTVTGRNFGNFSCSTSGSCAPPPPFMVAWWPFDEPATSTTAADVTHLSPAKNVAQLLGGLTTSAGGHTGRMLCVSSELAYAVVPNANQLGLAFGAGSFAADAWVKLDPGGGQRMLVEKRVFLSGSPYKTRGFALYYNGTQAFLEVGIGISTQVFPGPNVTSGVWHHLAVSVNRTGSLGRWYLNGVPQPAYNFTPAAGTVSSNADLYIGQSSPAFGGAAPLQGCVDDLELFFANSGDALPAASVAAIHAAGVAGKCPDLVRLPSSTTICAGQTSVQVCFTICNTAAVPQTYTWSLAGLPAGPGCTVAGPTSFSPGSGSVTIGAGACSTPICVTIPRPAGLTAHNATACFELSVVNDDTGRCSSSRGTIRADNCWCPTTVGPRGLISVPASFGVGAIGVPIDLPWHNPCGGTAIPYKISAVFEPVGHDDPHAVSLNGLPPGEPVIGTLDVPPGGDGLTSVSVSLPNGYDPMALYEIVLEVDSDGDGNLEPVDSRQIVPTYDDAGATDVEPVTAAADAVRLELSPNPFFRGSTVAFSLARAEDATLAVYDIGGRLVRHLHRGRLAAGPQRFTWNGRDSGGREAPSGVYFVRFESARLRLDAKLVKLR